jgi:hypothetical protein
LLQRSAAIVIVLLASIGTVSLLSSVLFGSTVLVFIGLGLTFWAAVLFYIRPQRYVRSDLMNSVAIPSMQTVDRVMTTLGYAEKGVYIPSENSDKTIIFVPSQPLATIPSHQSMEKETFVKNPNGMVILPPGLELANLIERQLGVDFKGLGLEKISIRLPKLVIEDLELAEDFDMQVEGDLVRFRFVKPIYSDLCRMLRGSGRFWSSLGCPISSAMACIVAQASGKAVAFEEDVFSEDWRTLVSSYRIIGG